MRFNKTFASLLLILAPLSGQAQMFSPRNQANIDNRLFHFGFSLGLHTQNLTIESNLDSPIIPASNVLNPGFNVGLIGEIRLHKYVSLRTTPAIFFGNKTVSFESRYGEPLDYTKNSLISNYVILPLGLKLSGERFNNYRPYLYVGASVGFDLYCKPEEMLLLKPMNYFVEIAFGLDSYLEYFKFAPEIKVCFGLNNVYETNRPDLSQLDYKPYAESIRKAFPGMLVLTFYFE